MKKEPFYKDHWLTIDNERLERYRQMFRWNPASRPLYETAEIAQGHTVADFGCGPGHTAIEIANWVGPGGHVYAIDINEDFISQTRTNASQAGLGDRLTAIQCDGAEIPLDRNRLDRLTTRNTLIYVDDPAQTLAEFFRIIKPGGKVHAIEGDWPMMIVEPVAETRWRKLVSAASHAARTPDIGRKLYGLMAAAGFSEIEVQLATRPDTDGRLLPMIRNLAGYARNGGKIPQAEIDQILASVDEAVQVGNYLALAPQFIVSATKQADKGMASS